MVLSNFTVTFDMDFVVHHCWIKPGIGGLQITKDDISGKDHLRSPGWHFWKGSPTIVHFHVWPIASKHVQKLPNL